MAAIMNGTLLFDEKIERHGDKTAQPQPAIKKPKETCQGEMGCKPVPQQRAFLLE